MRTINRVLFATALAALGGCAGRAHYSASAQVSTPELVEVEPGVMVVADYDEPVFYTDGYYWRYEGGLWYRSTYYDRAWIRISTPPVAVRRIDRPERFVHFHARADMRTRQARPAPRPAPIRTERDNREIEHDRADVRHDTHEVAHDRQELRRDQRELRRDRKELDKDKKRAARRTHRR